MGNSTIGCFDIPLSAFPIPVILRAMKTVILYYSRSGNTKALALKKALELDADIEEIVEEKKPLLVVGLYRALRRKKTAIRPIKALLDSFDKIIIMSPVWAAHPVSAINSVIECLPGGKKVELFMVSAGGGTRESVEKTKALITARACEVAGYTDVHVKRKGSEVLSQKL